MSNFTTTLFLIVAGVVVGMFMAWISFGRKRKVDAEFAKFNQAFLLIQNQIQNVVKTLDSKLGEHNKTITEQNKTVQQHVAMQFSQSAKIIRDVTERLTKLDETNRQVVNFSDQLRKLQDVLQNPKQRGVLGEYYLETVLKNVLPPNRFQMQYKFPDGVIVDAVIFLDQGKILPIDSKFSLENYNRLLEAHDPQETERLEKQFKSDVKNRIDETSKYIRPSDNTMDFAFMFIPAEAIYYDLQVNQVGAIKSNTRDLLEYAYIEKKVIIVSPTSFMAYLQTVLQGLRALQIEESAREIRKRIEDLGRHLKSYEEFMAKLGNNLGTTVNAYNSASKEFKKIDKDILKIAGTGMGTDLPVIDKPEAE
jgi:DNA recombination protein RmuC